VRGGGKLVCFSYDFNEADSNMTTFGLCLCLCASIVSDVSGNLHSCGLGRDHLWARITVLMMAWGMSCQSTTNFMFLLLKHSFPNQSSHSSHWSNFSI
jgi:hypothetical protein